ncbi:hypothetical protein DPMN_048270 [Dreissena polymorpha]|uniref:Uncharacterized protein n=1 Tax=Dreissena polymorpha TaxID=45954 RepID=A0A9D4DAX5_DREPO|nr:hypothetical protein DPMN_048270 [Dreissena polymorpha]
MNNKELLQQIAVLAGQQAFLDGQVALLLVRRRRQRRNRRQPRSCWVRPWLSAERRLQFGHYDRLMAELRMEDQQIFLIFLECLLKCLMIFSTELVQDVRRQTPLAGKRRIKV